MKIDRQSSDYIDHTQASEKTCELCGATLGTGNAGYEINAEWVIWGIAEALERNPIATEIALLGLINPGMSIRELSAKADRKGHAKVYNAMRKAKADPCGLTPLSCLYVNARAQQERFERIRNEKKLVPPPTKGGTGQVFVGGSRQPSGTRTVIEKPKSKAASRLPEAVSGRGPSVESNQKPEAPCRAKLKGGTNGRKKA